MENVAGQVIDADESGRCNHIDSYEEHELADDELSKSVDFCPSEADRIVEQADQDSAIIGFTVRIHHNRRSRVNNLVIGQDFVCSKEGFREKKYVCRNDRVLPPPPVTREGCPSMLRLALRDGVKWVVTKYVKEHNHPLMSPSKVPWRGSLKNIITEDEKDQRIRELTLELYNERQKCKRRCAVYREQLLAVLKDVEDYNEHMSKSVKEVIQRVREVENDDPANLSAGEV